MTRSVRGLSGALLLLAAGACASRDLASQSEEYDRLVVARASLRAEMGRDPAPAKPPFERPLAAGLARSTEPSVGDTELRFLDLARRAAVSARQAVGRDRALAAAYYRIALLSNWQAGKAGHGEVVKQSIEADENCARLNPAPPRDCALPMAVRQLAIVDSETAKVQALRALPANRDKNNTPENRAAYLKAFNTIAEAFDALRRDDGAAVPDTYVSWLRQQQRIAFCNAEKAFTAFEAMRTPDDQPNYALARARHERMRKALADAGLVSPC